MAGKIKLQKWDSAQHLKTEADIAHSGKPVSNLDAA